MSKFQTSSTVPALFNNFFPDYIQNFVSDRSIDFVFDQSKGIFDNTQVNFFRQQLDIDASQVKNIRQVHGSEVVCVDIDIDIDIKCPEADAIITNSFNCPIVIRTADCLPIFLFDPIIKVIALVHAGWRGTQKEILSRTILRMSAEFGCKSGDIQVAFGPRISRDAYQVGVEFIEYFPEDVVNKNGKYYFDLGSANKRQMLAEGIKVENFFDCGICTYSDSNYFSYRREALNAGRILSLIMMRN